MRCLQSLIPLLVFFFAFLGAQPREVRDIEICRDHLVTIGNSLQVYVSKAKQYPEELRELHQEGLIRREMFACPADGHFFGVLKYSYSYKKHFAKKAYELKLHYAFPELERYTILVCDNKNIHEVGDLSLGSEWEPEGRNVLLFNGDVVYLSKSCVDRVLRNQTAWLEEAQNTKEYLQITQTLLSSSRNYIEEDLKNIKDGKVLRRTKLERLKVKFLIFSAIFGIIVFLFTFFRGRSKQNQYELRAAENVTICIVLLLIFGLIIFYLTLMGEQLSPIEFFMLNIIACPALGFSVAIISHRRLMSKFFGVLTTICYLSLILFIAINSFFSSLLET